MGWPQCNHTLEYEQIDEETVWHGMTFHHFGLILSAIFALIAVLLSWWLIWRHATHYLKPWEQKHIIRVLFMVPIYAAVSFLSYYFYRHAIYFEVIRDCYEAFAIASFFALLCHYIAPDLHSQKDYFRGIKPKPWVWPMNWFAKCCGGNTGILRTPRSGLTWFNVIWFGVFQYCFVRVFMTLVAVITQASGRYCLESLNPAFAHIWVMVIEGGCVSIAMYCLIQFYVQLKEDLAEHRPLLKVAAIKLVIFLSFWQTLLISFLTSSGAIKPSARFQTPDIKIGIPAMLLCIEMAIFAGFHLIAFPWQVYDIRRSAIVASESAPGFLPDPNTAYLGGHLGVKALLDAYNPWDLIKAVGRGFRWVTVGRRTREQDNSYKPKISRPFAPEHQGGQSGTFASTIGNGSAFSAGKSGRYQPVRAEDEDRLLANPQAVPLSASANTFPRPGMRLPDDAQQEGDIGASGLYDAPGRYQRAHPSQPHHLSPAGTYPPQHSYRDDQETGIVDLPFEDRDTSYHGPGTGLTPVPPPAASHPYAHQDYSQVGYQLDGTESADSAGEWDDWSGAHGPHNQSDVALGSIAHEPPPRDHRARGPSPSEMWSEMQGHGFHKHGGRS